MPVRLTTRSCCHSVRKMPPTSISSTVENFPFWERLFVGATVPLCLRRTVLHVPHLPVLHATSLQHTDADHYENSALYTTVLYSLYTETTCAHCKSASSWTFPGHNSVWAIGNLLEALLVVFCTCSDPRSSLPFGRSTHAGGLNAARNTNLKASELASHSLVLQDVQEVLRQRT